MSACACLCVFRGWLVHYHHDVALTWNGGTRRWMLGTARGGAAGLQTVSPPSASTAYSPLVLVWEGARACVEIVLLACCLCWGRMAACDHRSMTLCACSAINAQAYGGVMHAEGNVRMTLIQCTFSTNTAWAVRMVRGAMHDQLAQQHKLQ